ncbi:MAG: hypothetical protein P8N17_03865, partial [Luminiphilus sp.]|nr:hypothetical protein [Luminiphilus sp.]
WHAAHDAWPGRYDRWPGWWAPTGVSAPIATHCAVSGRLLYTFSAIADSCILRALFVGKPVFWWA